jgi:hypothetical protein
MAEPEVLISISSIVGPVAFFLFLSFSIRQVPQD